MPKKKSDLGRSSKAARLAKLRRMREDPAVRIEKLRREAEAQRAKRLAESPEQRELRRKKDRINRKQRYAVETAAIKASRRNAKFEAMKRVQMIKVFIERREEDEGGSQGKKSSELNIKIKQENEVCNVLSDEDLADIRLTSDGQYNANSHQQCPTFTAFNESDFALLTQIIKPRRSVKK